MSHPLWSSGKHYCLCVISLNTWTSGHRLEFCQLERLKSILKTGIDLHGTATSWTDTHIWLHHTFMHICYKAVKHSISTLPYTQTEYHWTVRWYCLYLTLNASSIIWKKNSWLYRWWMKMVPVLGKYIVAALWQGQSCFQEHQSVGRDEC